MPSVLEKEKQKLEEQKKKFLVQEAIIKEKEKKLQFKRAIEIGKLAIKANLDKCDSKALLGAFLEIANQLKNSNQTKIWEERASGFLNNQNQAATQKFSISFKDKPSKEVLKELKSHKAVWNRYRNEFYMKGNIEHIQKLLSNFDISIQLLEDQP